MLVENFKLGTLEKWGFGNEWLEKNAPRVIRCSITGYGSSGPDAGLPGYDFILQAESGLMSICGEADGTPTKYGVAIVDVVTGLYACNVILAALAAREPHRARDSTSKCASTIPASRMLINVASNYLVTGKDARRFGNGHPSIVPYTTYPDGRRHDRASRSATTRSSRGSPSCSAIPNGRATRASRRTRTAWRNRELLDGLIAEALEARQDRGLDREAARAPACRAARSTGRRGA